MLCHQKIDKIRMWFWLGVYPQGQEPGPKSQEGGGGGSEVTVTALNVCRNSPQGCLSQGVTATYWINSAISFGVSDMEEETARADSKQKPPKPVPGSLFCLPLPWDVQHPCRYCCSVSLSPRKTAVDTVDMEGGEQRAFGFESHRQLEVTHCGSVS